MSLMCFKIPLCFAVAVLSTLSFSIAEKGIVLRFSPTESYEYLFNNRENDDPPLVSELLNEGQIKLFCDKYQLNAYDEVNAITDFWATIKTVDDVELESFKVEGCKKEDLVTGIKVQIFLPVNNNLDQRFEISYRDTSKTCHKRTYMVHTTPNEMFPRFDVDRDPPVVVKEFGWFGFGWCLVHKDANLEILGSYDDGVYRDFRLLKKYIFAIRFNCDFCWILCGRFEKAGDEKFIVDVIAGEALVDRVEVSTCSQKDLMGSIMFVEQYQKHPRFETVIMQYLMHDGSWYRRQYLYDTIKHVHNIMWMTAKVRREEPKVWKEAQVVSELR